MEPRVLKCDVSKTGEGAARVTRVRCHGQLVLGTSATIKEVVGPLIEEGGKVIVDLADVSYVDSMGLGALVGLKVSTLNRAGCSLELANPSARVEELMRLTNLAALFRNS
jgi:anti-sigma B factor antagonist